MELETRRFGIIEVDDEDIFRVPNGIPGFPGLRRVTLLGAGPSDPNTPEGVDDHSLFWIQDVDDGNLAFLCVVPWIAFPDYDIDIDEKSLGIDDAADVRVLSLLTTRRDDGESTMTANLRAPLVVDVRQRRLQQVILSDSRWPIRAPFVVLQASEVG